VFFAARPCKTPAGNYDLIFSGKVFAARPCKKQASDKIVKSILPL